MPTQKLQLEKQSESCIQSDVETASPFDELILSWNATRPQVGHFLISFCLKGDQESAFLPYALWGASGQRSFTTETELLTVNQDAIQLKDGHFASRFSVKIEAQAGADINKIRALFSSYTNSVEHAIEQLQLPQELLQLAVPTFSQRSVNHPRKNHLCSPTSTCTLCSFLKKQMLNPLHFADAIWDSDADIYGNWVFAIAEASHHLGDSWLAYAARLTSFDEIVSNLQKGIPSIISVRITVQEPLPGCPVADTLGHLLVVTGFDGLTGKIFCMDPAFEEESKTATSYNATDLFAAWSRRGGIAYLFKKII